MVVVDCRGIECGEFGKCMEYTGYIVLEGFVYVVLIGGIVKEVILFF